MVLVHEGDEEVLRPAMRHLDVPLQNTKSRTESPGKWATTSGPTSSFSLHQVSYEYAVSRCSSSSIAEVVEAVATVSESCLEGGE
jgi:hypothetical protein